MFRYLVFKEQAVLQLVNEVSIVSVVSRFERVLHLSKLSNE